MLHGYPIVDTYCSRQIWENANVLSPKIMVTNSYRTRLNAKVYFSFYRNKVMIYSTINHERPKRNVMRNMR